MSELLITTRVEPGSGAPAATEPRDRTRKYGSFTAVDRVSLTVAPGEKFALLGPNRAGKTTTFKMMTGLVTHTSGTARVKGHELSRQRRLAVWQIGAVLEGSRKVYRSLSAWQNLPYVGRLKGPRAAEIKPRAERLPRELNRWDRRDQLAGGISHGMTRQVAVAAALVTDPVIVLLDEPTLGLDVEQLRTRLRRPESSLAPRGAAGTIPVPSRANNEKVGNKTWVPGQSR